MLLSKANTRVHLFEFKKEETPQNQVRAEDLEEMQKYLHWAVTKKVKIHVFSEEVTLWMRRVKLLSSHEKMTGEIVSLGKENSVYIHFVRGVRLYN